MRSSQRLVTVAITAIALLALASDDGGPIDLLNQAITLTIDGDTTTSGRSSCSDYRARFLGTAESL